MTSKPAAVPIPADEEQRLARLRQYQILDTRPNEAFDRISRLASRLLDMPIALVTFLDADRQWFKSKVGLDAVESPRELAFCAHTICDSKLLLVPDAREDSRFADHPLVIGEPFVRFYAGVPLRSPDGYNVGTLCVVDHVPRTISPEDRLLLNDLAKIVIDEMELHALVDSEQEARKRLVNAIEAAPDGFVYFDKDDRLALCNDRYRALFPESAAAMLPGMPFETIVREAVARGQFPDAVGDEEAWIQRRLDFHRNTGQPIEQKLPDGRWVRVEERRTADGDTVGFRIDISELKKREAALEELAQREEAARTRLFDAIEALPDGFVYYDANDRLELCNSRCRELYALSADLMVPGTTFEEVIRGGVARGQYVEAIGREEEFIVSCLEAHRNPVQSVVRKLPDDRWVRITERRTNDGGTVGFRTDITELKQREAALEKLAQREEEARFRLFDAIEALPDGFVCYDADDRLVLCNQRYREIYTQSAHLMVEGVSFEEVIRGGVANGQYPAAVGNEEAWIQKRLEIHRAAQGPVEQELPDGRWIRIVERRTGDGGLVGFRTDITELKKREFALERLATTDSLTGALNRGRFMEDGEKELRRARRYGAPLSVLLIDIDYFKRVNDSHGHAVGDEVLRRLVATMAEVLREHDLICRYGGEEFAVLFPETDAAAAEVAAERVRFAIAAMEIPVEKGIVRPTVSIGGTQIDVHNDSLESALSRADIALYEAKEGGRNQARFARATCAPLKAVL